MANKGSWNKIQALSLLLAGGTSLLLAQPPLRAVSAEREIRLHVKFAELDQEKERQFGVNLLAGPGSRNNGVTGGGSTVSVSQALSLFTLDPKLNLDAFLKALAGQNVLHLLAEPTLVTTDGKGASFLAGGEFPVPRIQGEATLGPVTVDFRQYGLNLTFTPTITPSANFVVSLKQEVTTLDLVNAVMLNGFTLPGLSTRTTESTIALENGQSFLVAGLVNGQEQSALSKVPFLGSIPILKMFKSKDGTALHSDLIVIVTPEFVPGPSPVVEN